MRFTPYLQCCCDVLWSWVASCRPGPWLKPLGFSYTPCEGTESQVAGIQPHRFSDLSRTSPKETHLYRPDFFTSSYVSFPSTVRVISSEATVKTWDSTRTKLARDFCESWRSLRTSVHAEVRIVLVQCLQGGHVGRPFHDLVHPFNGANHLVPLLLGEDRRTLVLCNLTLTTKHTHFHILGLVEKHISCLGGVRASCTWWLVRFLTVCVHSNDEVIPHGLGLTQLVGVAVMHHVIAVATWQEKKANTEELLIAYTPLDHRRVHSFQVQKVTLFVRHH